MSKKDKQIKEKFNFTKLIGFLVVGCFCVFFINFIYESATILLDKTEETIDSTKRWCANCNTFHDINDETIEEVWCNNCQTWHAPNEESRTPNIR